jgi:hypothetical protein
MYPFLNHLLPDDFPAGILAFINWVIFFHCAVLVFYICGLAKELIMGAPPKPEPKKIN